MPASHRHFYENVVVKTRSPFAKIHATVSVNKYFQLVVHDYNFLQFDIN